MTKRGILLAFALLLILGFSALLTISVSQMLKDNASQQSERMELNRTVSNQHLMTGGVQIRRWASMSLCWGGGWAGHSVASISVQIGIDIISSAKSSLL